MDTNKNAIMTPMINTIALFILFLSREASAKKNSEVQKKELRKETLNRANILLDLALKRCDEANYKKIIADDVEFYDDRFGLNISKSNEIKSFTEKCERSEKMTRKLNYCNVDKLGDFGALQTGEHTFLLNDVPVGPGKFIHIWERKDNEWQLKRVVSYGHSPLQY